MGENQENQTRWVIEVKQRALPFWRFLSRFEGDLIELTDELSRALRYSSSESAAVLPQITHFVGGDVLGNEVRRREIDSGPSSAAHVPIAAQDDDLAWPVFLSYARRDSRLILPAIKTCQDRLSRLGIQVYLDVVDNPGEHPRGLIEGLSEGLARANIMIAFLTDAYFESEWCRAEAGNFLSQQRALSHSRVRPDLSVLPFAGEQCLVCVVPDELGATKEKSQSFLRELAKDFLFMPDALEPPTYGRLDDESVLQGIVRRVLSLVDGMRKHFRVLSGERQWFPYLGSPAAIWNIARSGYDLGPFCTNATTDHIREVISLPTSFDETALERLRQYDESVLHSLFRAIAVRSPFAKVIAEVCEPTNSTLMDPAHKVLGHVPAHNLRYIAKHGSPVFVLLNDAKHRPLIRELQSSYCHYVNEEGSNPLVDVSFLAALLVTIHQWFDTVVDEDDCVERLAKPLSSGMDIAEGFI